MSGSTLMMIEMVIVLVAVLGWGFWELHKLKKDK